MYPKSYLNTHAKAESVDPGGGRPLTDNPCFAYTATEEFERLGNSFSYELPICKWSSSSSLTMHPGVHG